MEQIDRCEKKERGQREGQSVFEIRIDFSKFRKKKF